MSATSNFTFLSQEFEILYNTAHSAELMLYKDPNTALYKARLFGEKLVELLFDFHALEFPRENTHHARLKVLEYDDVLPYNIRDLLHGIKHKGNAAVHQGTGNLDDAKSVLFSCFKVGKWFYLSYADNPDESVAELCYSLPENIDFKEKYEALQADFSGLEQKLEELSKQNQGKGLSAEQSKVQLAKNKKVARKTDMNEAETRVLIDAQLAQAGWDVDTANLNWKSQKTMPQRGRNMAIAEWPCGTKYADYALFIGTQLYGIIEAKKYSNDISTDLGQSKVYSQLVEAKNEAELMGQWRDYHVPFLFSTNGRPYLAQLETKSGIWFLDVRNEYNTSRSIKGWYSPEGLVKLYEADKKDAEEKLKNESADFLKSESGLGLRDYQIDAITAVEGTLLNDRSRNRILLAMATGTGKTRTIIGLCYRLIQSNRFKRILFLVDRTLLGKQALDSFKDNKIVGLNTFSEIYDVRGLKDALPDADTRLHVSTVQSLVQRIYYNQNEVNIPTVDEYDCIIVDEAHRGYLLDREVDEEDLNFKDQLDYVSKYRMVLDYFDATAIGLTATPALHTKEIFGEPVYIYSYREAVIDGFLIDHEPPYQIETKLSTEGISWKKGDKPKVFDPETNSIRELGEIPDDLNLDVADFNKKVITEPFNRVVVQQLVKELDPEGDEKTLVFAATDEHADLVVKLFKEEFNAIGIEVSDEVVQKITGKSYNPQEQVTRFKNEKYPNIVVTVDLLTTGVDVPAICNLVFIRRISSRILYEQMIGRATRRCDTINKSIFRIYDAVRIYESLGDYTQMKPVVPNPTVSFVQLVQEFDHIEDESRLTRQIEQLIAKIQRKRNLLKSDDEDAFRYNAKGMSPEELIDFMKDDDIHKVIGQVKSMKGLWSFLDQIKPEPRWRLVSDHEDEYLGTQRGYGNAEKPEDYLQGFQKFIEENRNKILALNMVCTKPAELDRKSLRELRLALDQHGYNDASLKVAWHQAKNEDIAADIISFIRTLAVGSVLISHEERIKRAVDKIRGLQSWNKVQEKWIDRFEMQLLRENILKVEDLNDSPFKDQGGFVRLNKIFDNQLGAIIEQLNDELYTNVS